MAYDYVCTFDLKECIETLGLNERGRVQQFVTNEVLKLSDPYIPFDTGALKQSGHIENGTDIVWGPPGAGPYARYQWGGKVWIDPVINAAGFKTPNGWRSRKGAIKVPTDRDLKYQNGPLRGGHWVDRMMQNGGKEKIEDGARKVAAR